MDEEVTLRFRGLMLEKFITRALAAGVELRQVGPRQGREALLVTNAPGAAALMALARRYSIDVTEMTRRGPGTVLRAVKKRWTLPASLLLCALVCAAFLGRVWVIEIRDLGGANAAQVQAALTGLRVRAGMARGADERALAAALLSALPEYAFVSLRVEAAKSLPAPDVYEPENARDLIAARDALLVEVDVLAGTASVKSGDVVRRGQVLIRGEERDTRETTRGVCALGAAMGRIWISGEAEAPLVESEYVPTGETRVSRALRVLDFRWPILRCAPFASERVVREKLPVGGLLIPVCVETETHIQTVEQLKTRDLQAVQDEILEIARKRAENLAPPNASPVDKWADFAMIEEDRVRARVVLEYLVNVAASRDALK